MTREEIEHMWKVASDNPNFNTNWHDPVVIAFAKLVAQHEREECAKLAEQRLNWSIAFTIRARSDTSSKHVDITEEHKHDN